jgi:hypothetical protein
MVNTTTSASPPSCDRRLSCFFWSTYMLADSSIPLESFTHSSRSGNASQLDFMINPRTAARNFKRKFQPSSGLGYKLQLPLSAGDTSYCPSPNQNSNSTQFLLKCVLRWKALTKKANCLVFKCPCLCCLVGPRKILARVNNLMAGLTNLKTTPCPASFTGGHIGPILSIVSALLGLDEHKSHCFG